MSFEGTSIELDHVAIVVRDMDTMIAFYREIIGLDLIRSGTVPSEAIERLAGAAATTARFAFLGAGRSAKIELGEFLPAGEGRDGAEAFDTIGLRHIAFNVPSISAIAERMSKSAYPDNFRIEEIVIAATGALLKRGLMRDPEGNAIEFIERLAAAP